MLLVVSNSAIGAPYSHSKHQAQRKYVLDTS
jgi:hypothetical protein